MGRGQCSKQTKACGFARLRIGTKVKCRCRYTRELFRINSLEPSKGCINMFSTKLKKEKAHDESIWSCSWGQLKITKEKERREDDENEEQADRESPMQEEEILEFVVSGGLDDTVKVWQYNDSVSGDNALKLRNSWDGHYLGVVSVDVSTEGTMIAASCLDSTIKLWEVPNGKKFCTIDAGPVDVWTVAFSPDSKHVISGSHSGKIHMYKIDGSLEQTLDTRGKFTLSIAYSPDGKYIASGANDGIINIFDVATSKLVHTLEGHAMPIRSLTFSPDSQFLLTASDDGHMKLYDVSHANVVGTMSGHASWVLSVAFSPDNKHFVSGSADRTVKLWELQDRQCLHTFSEHEDQVWGVKFSPDGKKIVSVSEDRSILIHECNFPEPEQPANPEEPTTDLLDMYN